MAFVNCSNCHTQLHAPPGHSAIRCAICQATTHISAESPSPAAPNHSYNNYYGGYCQNNGYQHPTPSVVSALALSPFHAPTPFGYSPSGQPAQGSGSGRKKAVIIGICYRNIIGELHGCINDAKSMEYMLIHHFNFPQDSIYMLTEEETNPMSKPTKQNIRLAMSWLVQGCQSGDSLLFYFSGHRGSLKNDTGDEIDGYDETLVPLDYETDGDIVDDEINATLVRPLPQGVKLHAVIDACHSGTMMDLPYLCRMDRSGSFSWEDHRPKSGSWKGTSGGQVISFSGCDDHQISANTNLLSNGESTGAMTYSFINAIINGEGATYGTLLSSMRTTIRDHNQNRGDMSSRELQVLLTSRRNSGIITQEHQVPTQTQEHQVPTQTQEHQVLTQTQEHQEPTQIQEPQLTANEPFDVYTKRFAL